MKTTYQKTGEYHSSNKTENQDAIFEAESTSAKVIVIADGVTTCKNGKTGAEIACQAIGKVLLDETAYIFSSQKRKIAKLLSAYVYRKLREKSLADNEAVESYSSTLSFVCYNKISGETMTFVLGDSLVYSINEGLITLDCNPTIFSNSKTYCTTTEGVADVIDINIIPTTNTQRFILATDGAWKTFYKNGELSKSFVQAAKSNKIINYLEKQQCQDDCSIVMMDIPKGA